VCCGYGYKVSEKIKVEGYGRYTCTWQEGKEVMLGRRNEKIRFEGAMSNRIRIGVKGEYEVREKVKPYIGIGGEEELGGAIKAKAAGMEIEEVRLEGMRGIGELGVDMEISERLRYDI
jgi:uncharacterized protein involved in copper resistance